VPYVGLKPVRLQKAAGVRMLPPVSLPSANAACPEATLAAEAPEEPPGTRVVSYGFLTVP
jgi:hypothetical protein